MNKLLLDEQPILVLPQLATIIGLNESIILQQVHYWIKNNESNNRNQKEGYYWVYNTFDEWHLQFPFWSERTVRRTFKKLEDDHLLVVGTFNKKSYDRTKWYRVNYKQLETLANNHKDKLTISIRTNWPNGLGQNGTMEVDKVSAPIPETNTETNTETNIYTLFEHWNNQGIIEHRKMNQKMKNHTNARLKEYLMDELVQAINNYKQVLDSPNHYWTHKWTFEDFMRPNNVTRFTDEAEPLTNFLKNDKKANEEFISMDQRYDPNKDAF